MKKLVLLFFVVTLFAMCKKDKKQSAASVTTNPVTEITSTSVKSGGAIADDGGSAITKKGLCYALHSGVTVADSITDDGAGNSPFTRTLSNLKANTTYYLSAYAINGLGTAYGNEVSFKTAAGLATVTTGNVSSIVALSAKASGEITNDGGAPITERGLVFSTTANPTTSNFKVTAGTGSGSFTATMSPLASQQTYYVRAYAINSHGTSYGNQVQFNAASANTVSDVEGNVYPYVTVGSQSWMATNLKVTKFKNGDAITNGLSGYNWATQPTPAYSFPNGLINKKDTLGLLYSIAVIRDGRGVCPSGWHVPTDNDWKVLEISQGMPQATADLEDPFPGRGTIGAKFLEGGSSGLNIQKAGMIYFDNGNPQYFGYNDWGVYWSSTPAPTGVYPTGGLWFRGFNLGSPDPAPIGRTHIDLSYALSVRCVKD
jgi:uncharacterized protein (TIGR02145 family)